MFGKKKRQLPKGCREILLKGRDAKRFRNIVKEKAKIEQVMMGLKFDLDGYDRAGAVISESYIRTGERWAAFMSDTNILTVRKVEKPKAPEPPKESGKEAPCPPEKASK